MIINKQRFYYLIPLLVLIVAVLMTYRNELQAAEPKPAAAIDYPSEPLIAFNVPALLQVNKTFSSKDMLGQVALLNVWSAACHFCRQEHAFLLEIKNRYHVPIYGLNYKEDPAYAINWLESRGNPYTMVGSDADGMVAMSLGISGTPETFIVDAHGMIRYRVLGVLDQESWDEKIYPIIQKLQKE